MRWTIVLDRRSRTRFETGKSKQNNELKIRLICIVELELIEAVRWREACTFTTCRSGSGLPLIPRSYVHGPYPRVVYVLDFHSLSNLLEAGHPDKETNKE